METALILALIDLAARFVVEYASRPDADPAQVEEMWKRLDSVAALVASKKPIPPPTQ